MSKDQDLPVTISQNQLFSCYLLLYNEGSLNLIQNEFHFHIKIVAHNEKGRKLLDRNSALFPLAKKKP